MMPPFIMCLPFTIGSGDCCLMYRAFSSWDLRSFFWAIPHPPFGLHRPSLPFICQLGVAHCILKNGVHEIFDKCCVDNWAPWYKHGLRLLNCQKAFLWYLCGGSDQGWVCPTPPPRPPPPTLGEPALTMVRKSQSLFKLFLNINSGSLIRVSEFKSNIFGVFNGQLDHLWMGTNEPNGQIFG